LTRIYVIVEGQTEESFIDKVVAPEFWTLEIYLIPILLGRTGGRPSYARVKKDVLETLKQERGAFCSTMLDFYGLGSGFPATPCPDNLSAAEKVLRIERAVKDDIIATVDGALRADIRFLPYLQLHEFEGLLFSDPTAFAVGIKQPQLAPQFTAIRQAVPTPEDINNDPNTAPSKRIVRLYPGYNKVLEGSLAAESIGLARMRQECPHFRDWLQQIEALD
jgi:hypothetical protein